MGSTENTLKIGGAIIAQSYGYGTIAVFLISLLSLLGVVLVPFLSKTYYSYLILGLIALAIGTMSGDAFLHLIPQALGLHQHSHSQVHNDMELPVVVNGSRVEHGHSHTEHHVEMPSGQDVIWKLLVVIGTIFVFHMMEILLRFMQDSMDKRKGKTPTGHHHHHHHNGPAAPQGTDSHNHLVLPALAIPMVTTKKDKNPGEKCAKNIEQNGSGSLKNRTKDQNLFRKWLASKRKAQEDELGSNCLTQLTTDKGCKGGESSGGSSAKLVICPDNYLEQHENHYDVVGRYHGVEAPTPRQQEDSDNNLGTPVLLRVCLNESDQPPPCHRKECDPQETTLCEDGQACQAQFGQPENDRLEHRHHEHKHDHTSCHHRDIMQAADIINTRKRELFLQQAGAATTITAANEITDTKHPFAVHPPTSGHVNHALTQEEGTHRRTVSTNSGLGGSFTNSPQQHLLEPNTYPVEKDMNNVGKEVLEKDEEEVKFKGRIGLPFCYGIQSLSLFLILGDIAHNIVDGIAIGAAFSSSLKEGLSTSFAVFCHELPHELGDFAVLVSTGMSFKMALMVNLFAACTSFLGLYISLSFASSLAARQWIFAMTAGMFLYVSLVDMLPELREIKVGSQIWSAFCQNLGIIVGVGLMLLVALYEHLLF